MKTSEAPRVLVVAYPEDEHGAALTDVLRQRGAAVVRASLSELRQSVFAWGVESGLDLNGERLGDGIAMSGIWRRPGGPNVADIDPRYGHFAVSESRDALRGALLASHIRWLNHPTALWQAEHKMYQLSVAKAELIPIPKTLVTNDVGAANRFVDTFGAVVAKAVRYGLVATQPEPLMAWVQTVDRSMPFEFGGVPVMLQRYIKPIEHLRVVTVDGAVFVSSLRSPEVDWRAQPEETQTWTYRDTRELPTAVESQAVQLARALGLGYSSQDWIIDSDGRGVFLEANPNGQWLFLDEGHRGEITMAIASWLMGRSR